MKNTKLLLAIVISATLLTGCQNTHGISTNLTISSGLNAYKAVILSDVDTKAIANQGHVEIDSGDKVISKFSRYGKRLAKITKTLGNDINGMPVSYRVYMTSDVNAWAMANGCVRIYSGLMSMMNGNEIKGVLGRGLDHVALGHSLAEMKASYTIAATRDTISTISGVASQFSRSQLGDIAGSAINTEYPRDKESEADDFSFDLLKKHGINIQGLVSSFGKLASLGGGHTQPIFDSHPPSTKHAQHIRDRIASGKQIIVIFRAGLLPARYNYVTNPHLNADKTGFCTQR